MEVQHQGQPAPRMKTSRFSYLWLSALLVVALSTFVVTWLIVRAGSGETAAVPTTSGPVAVTEAQLHALAAKSKFPVYWAGPKSGAYELTRTDDGRIYVRYLTSSDEVGSRAPKFLTVGTYPRKQALLAIRRAAKQPGALSLPIANGGLLVFNTTAPKSVYFGYPKASYQVEVYDPSPEQARALVLGGKITPIG